MTPEQWKLLLDILKAATPFVLSFIVYYVKQLNDSIKTMETDINEIKTGLSNNGINLSNMKERIGNVEMEQKEQLRAWIDHTNKYEAGLDWSQRQVQKQP